MRQKGIVGIFVLVLVLVIAVAGGVYYFGEISVKEESPRIEQTTQATLDPTADWRIYKNTKYFYSIKYPQGWIVWGYSPDSNSVITEKVNDLDEIYISKTVPEEQLHRFYGVPRDGIFISAVTGENFLTPQQYIEKSNSEQIQANATCRFGAVGSLGEELTGIFVVGLNECDLSSLGFVATHNNVVIEITQALFHSIYDSDLPDRITKEKIFKQMMFTFRFD